jgi:hypothetical protein
VAWIGRTIWRGVTTAGDDAVGEATTEQNKRMKLTKGGWRRGEGTWSACSAVRLPS